MAEEDGATPPCEESQDETKETPGNDEAIEIPPPELFEDFEGWVEQHGGRPLTAYDAPVAVMPSEFFDEDELPNVDMAPALIDRDGKKQLTPPFWWQAEDLQGITLLAREHIAYMWVTSSEEKLLTEAMLRRKADYPLPPIVKRAVRRAGGVNE